MSPLQKLQELHTLGAERLVAFPVFCIDDLFDGVKDLNYYVSMNKIKDHVSVSNEPLQATTFGSEGGKDVSIHYQNICRLSFNNYHKFINYHLSDKIRNYAFDLN